MRFRHRFAIALIALTPLACQTTQDSRAHQEQGEQGAHGHGEHAHLPTHAIAVMTPTKGNNVSGTVTFVQRGDRVTISAHIHGLSPNGTHAWHIHEWGDISSDDGTATGGHYNPEGHDHALPTSKQRHAGDLGNLTADESGHATAVLTVENITVAGEKNPIVGRAVIIHALPDDGGQPTGNAGARISQGVIGIDNPE